MMCLDLSSVIGQTPSNVAFHATQVVGRALPPRSLMPKVVFRPAAKLTSRPLPKVVTRTMQPTLEVCTVCLKLNVGHTMTLELT